ncbi:ABC transporter permease [Marinifilum sp. D714]|uniref:ABC transporter permease n=1 Tax=Marinifilum sp. D714 TaxID=2937523 RepID=UPI0027D07EBC|nr:ABC transporter permease [Marinifilum sp. D714]MDQ2180027.1 ABC transporter permease [Marinifilum sp. D714]
MNILTKKNKWAAINIIGIAIAFASVLFVSAYTIKELSFDNFHSKADDIYRLHIDKPGRVGFLQTADDLKTATISNYYLPSLFNNFPQIKDVALLKNMPGGKLEVRNESFDIKSVSYTNHSFFNIFDFKLLQGNKKELFKNTNEAVLSKKAAIKYFGTTDILGKEFKVKSNYYLNGEEAYTIKAILEDFPDNSHMSPDILLSEKNEQLQNPFAYTYLLLEKENQPETLVDALNKYWKKNVKEGELSPTFRLLKLKDIHLKSHKTDELGTNGNWNSIIVLIFGALIVLLISLVNFSNINYVKFTTQLKDVKIKIINGASIKDLSANQIKKTIVQITISLIIGTVLIVNFNKLLHFDLSYEILLPLFLKVSLLFTIAFVLISILPFFTKKISNDLNLAPKEGSKKFIVSLVFQFVLSISAIILTIVLHKQVKHIHKMHPGDDKEAIVAISNIPYQAIAQFDLLKERLEQHIEIEYLSATMMPPGMVSDFEHPFDMEGVEKGNRIMINSVEKDFFKLFNIEPIAGSVNLTSGSDFVWESKAIIPDKKIANEMLSKLDAKHTNFKEQYILNEAAIKKLGFKDPKEAIGKQFQYHFRAPEYFRKGEVVAVIKDLHYTSLFEKELPMAFGLKRIFNGTFLLKINKQKKAKALEILKKEWDQLFTDDPLKCAFLNDIYAKLYRNQYNEMRTLTLFAILSILLSIMGMYALSSYSIQHKTKEIGIRKANGASSLEIMLQLISEYVIWVALAFVIASPIAFYAADDWLKSFAYRIDLSWWIFALAGVIAILIAIITVSWQTYNAARKDPVYALKYE